MQQLLSALLTVTPIISSAAPCVLSEVCQPNTACEGGEFNLEFDGSPARIVTSNWGEFEVNNILAAGEVTSKIRGANGRDWTVTSTQDLLVATNVASGERPVLYLTKNKQSEMVATIVSVTRKYVEYPPARRVFAGPCEQEF